MKIARRVETEVARSHSTTNRAILWQQRETIVDFLGIDTYFFISSTIEMNLLGQKVRVKITIVILP